MDRRKFIRDSAMVTAAAAACGLRTAGAETPAKPNVLLFIVDQMRQPRWFPEDARLPGLDRLKSRGMEFTSHFASAVPCSPSRACLMTGLHMDSNGVHDNMHEGLQPSLDARIPTLGQISRDAGYETPYFGKWHLSMKQEEEQFGLDAYGFDLLMPFKNTFPFPGLINDDDVTRSACRWLKQDSKNKRPWFMTLSLMNPHDICTYPRIDVPPIIVPDVIDRLPDNWDDDLKGKPMCQSEYQKAYGVLAGDFDIYNEKAWRRYLDYYYYLTLDVDKLLGQTLDTLDKTGQTDNTIVIFTSDHGDMGGSHRLRSKGPCAYMENTNVPLVISWPGRIPGGKKSHALCQNVDIFPTLAGLTGVDAFSMYPGLAGKDLGPVLSGPEGAEVTDHVLYSFTDNIKIRALAEKMGRPTVTSPHNIRAIREKDWIYARYFDPAHEEQEYELYDLRNDPLEMKNLANDPGYGSARREMADKLREAEEKEMATLDINGAGIPGHGGLER